MIRLSILFLSLLLNGCAVRWVLLEGNSEPAIGITSLSAKVGLDLREVDTVQLAERESRVWRFPMQAQLVERTLRARYRETQLQFEIMTPHASMASPKVDLLLRVAGGIRVLPFTCVGAFKFEVTQSNGKPMELIVEKTRRFGVATEIKDTCEGVMQEVIAELDQFFVEES